jgi:hypothetical protein
MFGILRCYRRIFFSSSFEVKKNQKLFFYDSTLTVASTVDHINCLRHLFIIIFFFLSFYLFYIYLFFFVKKEKKKFYWPNAAIEAYDDFRNILFLFKISKRTKEQTKEKKQYKNIKMIELYETENRVMIKEALLKMELSFRVRKYDTFNIISNTELNKMYSYPKCLLKAVVLEHWIIKTE